MRISETVGASLLRFAARPAWASSVAATSQVRGANEDVTGEREAPGTGDVAGRGPVRPVRDTALRLRSFRATFRRSAAHPGEVRLRGAVIGIDEATGRANWIRRVDESGLVSAESAAPVENEYKDEPETGEQT